MKEEEFCRWLKGFFEIANPDFIDPTQTKIIKEHLDLVYNKVTNDWKPSPGDILEPFKFEVLDFKMDDELQRKLDEFKDLNNQRPIC